MDVNKEYRLPNMGGSTIATRLTVKMVDELRKGRFMNVDRLPSEMELAEQFGVSRSVIRDVLSNLEREGYVERGRGVGTVVNRQIVELPNRLDMKFEYNDIIRGLGAVPGTENVRLYQQQADEAIAEKLEIDMGAVLVVCEKVVLASGQPVIYSIDILNEALFEGMNWRMFDWASPVYKLLEEHCGIVVDSSISHLSAVKGGENIRQSLRTAEGDALILLEEVGYYKLSRPILLSYGYYTNYFEFTLLRKNF